MSDLNSILNEFVNINSMADEVEKESVRKFWRPTKPKTTIRFLPPFSSNGEKLPWMEHKVHWINAQPYECLNQTMVDKDGHMHQAEPCPICKMAKALYSAKTEQATELAKSISAKTRNVSRIIVRDENSDTPVFYELPYSIHDILKTTIISKEWGTLVGPLDGRDFTIQKEGEGKFTKYGSSNFKPVTSEISNDRNTMIQILQKAKDMSYNSLVSFQDANTLKEAALENDDIASFFGVSSKPTAPTAQASVVPVSTTANTETYSSAMEDLVPPVVVEEPEAKTEEENLDDLLSSLNLL